MAILEAIVELIRLISRLVPLVDKMKQEGSLKAVHAALEKAEIAHTPEERSRAMLDLVRAVSRPR